MRDEKGPYSAVYHFFLKVSLRFLCTFPTIVPNVNIYTYFISTEDTESTEGLYTYFLYSVFSVLSVVKL